MDNSTIQKIIDLNNSFYQHVGEQFDTSRQYYWKGWEKTGKYIASSFDHPISVLDLACGNGRFGDFILDKKIPISFYKGLDSSDYLLDRARNSFSDERFTFEKKDLLLNTFSIDGRYDLITVFGFMHHIPSSEYRLTFLQNCIDHLLPNGLLISTFWSRFNKSGIKKFEELSETSRSIYPFLEKNDCFYGWDNIPEIERYCHLFEDDEVKQIGANLKNVSVIEQYRSDGKKNPDNIYLILKKS